jgi:hypothetical protein
MRAFTNDQFVKRRAKIGQIASWGGLGVLAIGMVISFRSQPGAPNYQIMIIGSFICLIVGFIAAQFGSYNMRRFGRSPRPDERLARELKGFDDRYMLFSWMLPAAYVFAGPSGVYAFAVREQGGKITNTGERWRQPFSVFRVLTAFGQEGLGNPSTEAQDDARKLQDYLERNMPELELEVQPLALFLNPKVELELNNPAIPVIQSKGLKALLRQRAKQQRIEKATLQQMEELFTTTAK